MFATILIQSLLSEKHIIKFVNIFSEVCGQELKITNAKKQPLFIHFLKFLFFREAAKTVLLCNNQACNNQGTSGEVKPVTGDTQCIDEDGYFSTYDHFAIHHEMLQVFNLFFISHNYYFSIVILTIEMILFA